MITPPSGYTPDIDNSIFPYISFELYFKSDGTDTLYAEVFKYPSCETATTAGTGSDCTQKWDSNGEGRCHETGGQCVVKANTTTGTVKIVCCD